MARIIKAAAAAAAVVVMVVVGGGPGGRCVAAHGDTKCTPYTKLQKHEEEKIIHSEAIPSLEWFLSQTMYVVPLTGFEGVRAEVTTSKETFQAWFPIMDYCSLNNSNWRQVFVMVMKTTTTLTVDLVSHNCHLSCVQTITDAGHTSWVGSLQNLKVFARGASMWRLNHPPYPCRVEEYEAKLIFYKVLPSCTNPPPISTSPPACVGQNEGLALTLLGVALVIVVVMIVIVVVAIIRVPRQQQNKT